MMRPSSLNEEEEEEDDDDEERLLSGAIPREILAEHSTSTTTTTHSCSGGTVVDETKWTLGNTVHRRVKILPGSMLPGPPPPPSTPPPVPTHLVKMVVLGPPQSGKTSLVEGFVHRRPPPPASLCEKSFMNYYKKDVCFWQENDRVGCVRLQMWDVNMMEKRKKGELLQPLLTKSSCIVLMVSVQDGLPNVVDRTRSWMKSPWLQPRASKVVLFLSKCDLFPKRIQPEEWIRLGSKLLELQHELGLRGFHMVSAYDDNDLHDVIMGILRQLVNQQEEEEAAAATTTTTVVVDDFSSVGSLPSVRDPHYLS